MKFSKFALISFVISLLVLVSATVAFVDPPETHPLAPILFPIVLIAYLPEIPLSGLTRYLGFPIVLPTLGILFAFLSLRKKENKKILAIVSIVLVALGLLIYLISRY